MPNTPKNGNIEETQDDISKVANELKRLDEDKEKLIIAFGASRI